MLAKSVRSAGRAFTLSARKLLTVVNDEGSIQEVAGRIASLSKTAVRFGAMLDSIDAHNFVRVINPIENAPIASS